MPCPTGDFWSCHIPDPRVDIDLIKSGLPYNPIYSCQYFIKGLPGVCKYWDGDSCTFEVGGGPEPTGYNNSYCDRLGRRAWCDQYNNEDDEDLDEYVCIAPCMERSGVGKQVASVTTHPQYEPVPKEEILGYNEGKCDGSGMGRGAAGEGLSLEVLLDTKRICNYYRPYNMGFGFTEPQQIIWKSDGTIDVEAMKEAVMDELNKRLPYHFKVYNIRARALKCAYWDQDYGTPFVVSDTYDGIVLEGEPFDVNGRITYCTCPDDISDPYCTRDLAADTLPMVKQVWSSEANTVVCNGAKPECPCYTGEWIYCVDDQMHSGMRVTAEQLLEIRFWLRSWSSQEEYELFFEDRPNYDDPTTADIYTFEYWEKLNATDAQDSLMMGKRVRLCVPAQPGRKEFITDNYVLYDDIKYTNLLTPVPVDAKRTRGTTAEVQVTFPTLIRDLEDIDIVLLEIIYPYIIKNPFEAVFGCDPDIDDRPCVKRTCEIEDDEVSVVGVTVRNKEVICFNANFIEGSLPSFLKDYYSASDYKTRNPALGDKIYNEIENYLNVLHEQDLDGTLLNYVDSDEFGLYTMGPIKLERQELNTLVVIVDLEDSTYEFRKIDVWSQWHGGMIVQSRYTRTLEEDAVYVDGGDEFITPPGSAQLSLVPLEGRNRLSLYTTVSGCMVIPKRDVETFSVSYTIYSYCIKKKTVEDLETDYWLRVGNYGLIWAEINDSMLNYFMDWGISKAYMDVYELNEDGDVELSESVEMSVVFPTGAHSQVNIPRNAVMLEPTDGKKRWFDAAGEDKAVFRVTYYYHYFSNDIEVEDNEEIVWPNFDSDAAVFSDNIMNVEELEAQPDSYLDGIKFEIDNISLFTPHTIGFFKDDDNALVSIISTKPLISIPRIFCRSVEINYSWDDQGRNWRLEPAYGFAERVESPTDLGTTSNSSTPLCGDHNTTPLLQIGPMWYPFNQCEPFGTYDIYLVSNSCTMPYDNVPRSDMRAKAPDKFYALFLGEGTIAACSNDYIYGFTVMDRNARFTGYANIIPFVNADYYAANEWSLPPFGNTSRELVERFLSIDRVTYQSLSGGTITYETRWLPKVIDNTDFNFTFNSTGYGVSSSPSFADLSQLNYLRSLEISETLDENRYRFDEVFAIRKEPRVAYPDPAIEDDYYSSYFYCFYKFLEESMVWAWQEKWEKEVERDLNIGSKLNFVYFEQPDYVFDMYKEEHRKTVTEGLQIVYYTAPEFDDSGNMTKYPKISIGGYFRYFGIVYETYDRTQIEWKDENDGHVGGSGGDTGVSIYEKTSGSEWEHDANILFDFGAVTTSGEAYNEGRAIAYSYDSNTESWNRTYYNRGLIAHITKDRLIYLPHNNSGWDHIEGDTTVNPNVLMDVCNKSVTENYYWLNSGITTITFLFEEKGCPSTFSFNGLKGLYSCTTLGTEHLKTARMCKPRVTITLGGQELCDEPYELPSDLEIRERELNLYQVFADLKLYPNNMVNKVLSVTVTIEVPQEYYAYISKDSFTFQKAEYKDEVEYIRTWERKYRVSRGDVGTYNLNGFQEPCKPRYGFESGGIYWPKWDDTDGEISAQDKMRSIYTGDYYEDSVALDTSEILTKEEQYQKDVYEAAYNLEETGDYKIYNHYLPVAVESFFVELGGVAVSLEAMVCEAHKYNWENGSLTLSYEEVEVWHPEGHYYAWDTDNVVGQKCYERDYVRSIFKVKFVHRHGGAEFSEPAANAFTAYAGTIRNGYIIGKTIVNRALNINTNAGPDSFTTA